MSQDKGIDKARGDKSNSYADYGHAQAPTSGPQAPPSDPQTPPLEGGEGAEEWRRAEGDGEAGGGRGKWHSLHALQPK